MALLRLGAALLVLGAAMQDEKPQGALPEYVLKAGFLYNFAKYVDWPEGAFEKEDSPISIGVVGKDPFGEDLDKTLKEKVVRGRSFTIQRFTAPDKMQRCHVLFVARSEKERLKEILKQVDGWPVLVVGEDEGFAAAGGTVNILIDKDKPRLEVNPDAAEKAKLTINAKLLRLATIVKAEK